MRLVLRLIAIITALSFAGSSTLSAMPLVWCIGKDGHRAVEAVQHKQIPQIAGSLSQQDEGDDPHTAPCTDWQLLSATGLTQAKGGDEAPKGLVALIVYPPLKVKVQTLPQEANWHATPGRPGACTDLRALRTVILRI